MLAASLIRLLMFMRRAMVVGVLFVVSCSQPHYDLPDIPPTPKATPVSPRLRTPVAWRLSPQDAQELLMRTRMFVFREPSRQVQAFNVTYEQPDARRRFLLIAGQAQLTGRFYALCALRALDVAESARLDKQLMSMSIRNTVLVYDAGVPSERPAVDLLPLVRSPTLLTELRGLKNP